MVLKLGMKLYKVYMNYDPVMTLTFVWQGLHMSPMHLNGENR